MSRARTPGAFPAALRAPLLLEPNRVSRFYRGGALLDAFRGEPVPGDSDRPEDWIGSTTSTWRPAGAPSTLDGLSTVVLGGRRTMLRDLVARYPAQFAGDRLTALVGPTTGLLVKLLDSADRLPVHGHPTRGFARRHLGSRFGKTEAWIVLGAREVPTREAPNLRLGFRRPVPREELLAWIEHQATDALLAAMHLRPAVPGDVWLIPAGQPHAIGAGVFLLELQEPTDFSVVAETAGVPIARDDAHLGLGWQTAVDSFDRAGLTESGVDRLRIGPAPPIHTGDAEEVRLLWHESAPFFRAARLRVAGRTRLPYADSFLIAVVTKGEGIVAAPDGSLEVRTGTTFALAAAAAADTVLEAAGGLELIVCLGPDPEALASADLT